MARMGTKKPWRKTDEQKHQEVPPNDIEDEEDISGHATDPEKVGTTLDEAHEAGLYDEASDEGEGTVEEVSIADQINRDEEEHKKED